MKLKLIFRNEQYEQLWAACDRVTGQPRLWVQEFKSDVSGSWTGWMLWYLDLGASSSPISKFKILFCRFTIFRSFLFSSKNGTNRPKFAIQVNVKIIEFMEVLYVLETHVARCKQIKWRLRIYFLTLPRRALNLQMYDPRG